MGYAVYEESYRQARGERKPDAFTYGFQVPTARLEEAARAEYVTNEEHALPGCAAMLELIAQFGCYLDDDTLEAAAASVPDYVVDHFVNEWIERRGKKFGNE